MNLRAVTLHDEAIVAKNATIVGEATIGKRTSIFPGAVIRADSDTITIGEFSNIQDNAIVHVNTGSPCKIGNYVTVGHGANVHACTVEDNVIVGMNAVIMDDAVIGENSIIGAGSVVGKGKVIPPNSIVVGIPGKVINTNSEEGIAHNRSSAVRYEALAQCYVDEGIFVLGKDASGKVPELYLKQG
ncbi:MAG: gamma carbonic anhydrase family protein [Anaerotardibacter sp.]